MELQKLSNQENTDKWDCIKPKSFFTAKETITRLEETV
jgi:hypothetical protein